MSRGAVNLRELGTGSASALAKDAIEKAGGRKGRDNQEAVTRPQEVEDQIVKLEKLCVAAQDAAKDYSNAVKKVAEKSGYLASNIKALVSARVKDRFSDKKRDAERQLELFHEVGE